MISDDIYYCENDVFFYFFVKLSIVGNVQDG